MKNKLLQAIVAIVLLASSATVTGVAIQFADPGPLSESVDSGYPAPPGPWDGYPVDHLPTPTLWWWDWKATPTYPPQPTLVDPWLAPTMTPSP